MEFTYPETQERRFTQPAALTGTALAAYTSNAASAYAPARHHRSGRTMHTLDDGPLVEPEHPAPATATTTVAYVNTSSPEFSFDDVFGAPASSSAASATTPTGATTPSSVTAFTPTRAGAGSSSTTPRSADSHRSRPSNPMARELLQPPVSEWRVQKRRTAMPVQRTKRGRDEDDDMEQDDDDGGGLYHMSVKGRRITAPGSRALTSSMPRGARGALGSPPSTPARHSAMYMHHPSTPAQAQAQAQAQAMTTFGTPSSSVGSYSYASVGSHRTLLGSVDGFGSPPALLSPEMLTPSQVQANAAPDYMARRSQRAFRRLEVVAVRPGAESDCTDSSDDGGDSDMSSGSTTSLTRHGDESAAPQSSSQGHPHHQHHQRQQQQQQRQPLDVHRSPGRTDTGAHSAPIQPSQSRPRPQLPRRSASGRGGSLWSSFSRPASEPRQGSFGVSFFGTPPPPPSARPVPPKPPQLNLHMPGSSVGASGGAGGGAGAAGRSPQPRSRASQLQSQYGLGRSRSYSSPANVSHSHSHSHSSSSSSSSSSITSSITSSTSSTTRRPVQVLRTQQHGDQASTPSWLRTSAVRAQRLHSISFGSTSSTSTSVASSGTSCGSAATTSGPLCSPPVTIPGNAHSGPTTPWIPSPQPSVMQSHPLGGGGHAPSISKGGFISSAMPLGTMTLSTAVSIGAAAAPRGPVGAAPLFSSSSNFGRQQQGSATTSEGSTAGASFGWASSRAQWGVSPLRRELSSVKLDS